MFKYIALLPLFAAQNVFASGTQSAISLVKQYSTTVACSVNPASFKAVQTIGESGREDVGDEYVVYWEGDLGCFGGNVSISGFLSSISGFLSVVRKNGFGQPLVEPYIKSPDIQMVCADKIAVKNGLITLSGITYDDDDSQHSPSKPIEVTFKTDDDKIKVVKKNLRPKAKISAECVQNVR